MNKLPFDRTYEPAVQEDVVAGVEVPEPANL